MIYLCPSKMVDIDYSLYIRYGNYTISMFTCSSSFNDSLNNILYLWIQSNYFEFYPWYKIIRYRQASPLQMKFSLLTPSWNCFHSHAWNSQSSETLLYIRHSFSSDDCFYFLQWQWNIISCHILKWVLIYPRPCLLYFIRMSSFQTRFHLISKFFC